MRAVALALLGGAGAAGIVALDLHHMVNEALGLALFVLLAIFFI